MNKTVLKLFLFAVIGSLVIVMVSKLFARRTTIIIPRMMSQPYLTATVAWAESGTLGTREVGVRENPLKTQVLAMLTNEGIDTVKADRIIACESTWNPQATNLNRNGSNDMGLWQINSVHGLSDDVRLDPIKSTEFAVELIKKKGFAPWVCQ